MRLDALFRLAFAPAPPLGLTSPHTVTRWLILQKARHRDPGRNLGDSLTDCKPTVSGTVSLPSRGAFHLSLTVLVRYRSPDLYLALRSGLRRFMPAFTVPALLGNTELSLMSFAYGAITLYGATFQNASARHQLGNSVMGPVAHLSGPTTPTWQRHRAITPRRFRLFPFRSPLLRESHLLSLPRVTEMFQFTRFPLPALCVQTGVTPHDGCRVSPFGHPRIEACSAAPRGLSQPSTSFIGIRRQGIHRWLFIAWENSRCSCSLCSSQGARHAPKISGVDCGHGERPGGRHRGSAPVGATLPHNGTGTAASARHGAAPKHRREGGAGERLSSLERR